MSNGAASGRARWYANSNSLLTTLTAYRKYLDHILTRRGPFTDEEWVPGEETITSLEQSKVL